LDDAYGIARYLSTKFSRHTEKTYKAEITHQLLRSLLLKVNSIADNAISVEIDKEDYSVADIVHKELLSIKHVKFAGVPPPHPLIKTLTVTVHTDGSKPTKALLEAIEIAQAKVSELLDATKQAFPNVVITSPPSDRQASTKEAPSSGQST
jgi:DNA-directed RNA polymerase subunit L